MRKSLRHSVLPRSFQTGHTAPERHQADPRQEGNTNRYQPPQVQIHRGVQPDAVAARLHGAASTPSLHDLDKTGRDEKVLCRWAAEFTLEGHCRWVRSGGTGCWSERPGANGSCKSLGTPPLRYPKGLAQAMAFGRREPLRSFKRSMKLGVCRHEGQPSIGLARDQPGTGPQVCHCGLPGQARFKEGQR